ncbi:MAG: hypothetical protein HYR70_05865 [Chloroflexi bacterium]|nr:hypothetical protein [Chloroflexota bacterium]MBI3338761.1 hypothetical protein [Chloroflexota bacterium]
MRSLHSHHALFLILAMSVFACAAPFFSAPVSSGAALFKDDFSSPTSGWDRTRFAEGIMDYDSGGYRILVNVPQVNFVSTPRRDFADVQIEADAGRLAGPDENRIGLICRYLASDYYFFIISSDGYYGLGIFTKGRAVLLGQSEMQFSDKINQGMAVNRLRADCNGDTLTFYANGAQLAQVHDPTLTHGDFGLLAGTFSQPGADIVFDNFSVIKP